MTQYNVKASTHEPIENTVITQLHIYMNLFVLFSCIWPPDSCEEEKYPAF